MPWYKHTHSDGIWIFEFNKSIISESHILTIKRALYFDDISEIRKIFHKQGLWNLSFSHSVVWIKPLHGSIRFGPSWRRGKRSCSWQSIKPWIGNCKSLRHGTITLIDTSN